MPKSALGTVDRMISFNNLEVGHLPKQQVVASDDPHQGSKQRSPCGILILNFDYIWRCILRRRPVIPLIFSELSGMNLAATTCYCADNRLRKPQ